MVKVIYNGDCSPMRIRAYSVIIAGWSKGEVKDLDKKTANKILENKNFSLVSGEIVKDIKVEVEKPKEEEFDLDLNDDGVIDKKDMTIAGKTLAYARRKKRE